MDGCSNMKCSCRDTFKCVPDEECEQYFKTDTITYKELCNIVIKHDFSIYTQEELRQIKVAIKALTICIDCFIKE